MKTTENMAFSSPLSAMGRSVGVEPRLDATKPNEINGIVHKSYGMAVNENQFPAAVSKNGSPIALDKSAKGGFNLGTITDFMVLKITVNDHDTKPTSYLLSGIDGDHWLCKFDLAEILGYSRTLTASEEASVGGYLAAKYGIKTAYPAPANHRN